MQCAVGKTVALCARVRASTRSVCCSVQCTHLPHAHRAAAQAGKHRSDPGDCCVLLPDHYVLPVSDDMDTRCRHATGGGQGARMSGGSQCAGEDSCIVTVSLTRCVEVQWVIIIEPPAQPP